MSCAFLTPVAPRVGTSVTGRRLSAGRSAPPRHRVATPPKACFQIPGVDMAARAKAIEAAAAAEAESNEPKVDVSSWNQDIPIANLLVLTGRLGADPILRHVGRNGTPLCTFSLAVNSNIPSLREGSRHTSWYRVNIWGPRGEQAAGMLRKGMRVGVHGKVGVDEYVDKSGRDRTNVYILAKAFEILQSKNEFGSTVGMGGGGGVSRSSYNSPQQNNAQRFQRNGPYTPAGGSPSPSNDTQDPF